MSVTTADRIEQYTDKKSAIIDQCERELSPLFSSLLNELKGAASVLVGDISNLEDWTERMVDVLHSINTGNSSMRFQYSAADFDNLKRILKDYEICAGVKLRYTLAHESGMDLDEVNFVFDCSPWRELFRNELESVKPISMGAFIWINHFDPENAVGTRVGTLPSLELRDLLVVEKTFDAYWQPALSWVKLRCRSHYLE